MVPPTADFHYFFIRFPWTALTFSKKTPPTKNQRKPYVFICFLHFRVCARASKINRKSHRTRFSNDSRHRGLSKDDIFGFETAKWSPRPLRGASGSLLELLWDPPGRQLDPLGAPLGRPWELRGRSWALLVRSWRRFLSQVPETSPAGSDFPGFQLRLMTKTCDIQPKACENHCESLPAAPRLERRIPTRVRRSREASSIRRTLRLRRERSV